MKMRSVIALVGLALYVSTGRSETFWISNHSHLTKIENGDPNNYNIKEWQIRLYSKDGPPHYWGLCVGKTIDEVQKQLSDGQKLDEDWARFLHKSVNDIFLNYQHPSEPIAILKDPHEGSRAREIFEMVQKADERVDFLRDAFENTLALADLDNSKDSEGKFYHFGEVLKDYAETFQKVMEKQKELRAIAEDKDSTLKDFSHATDEFVSAFKEAETGQWKSVAAYGETLIDGSSENSSTEQTIDCLVPLESGRFVDGKRTFKVQGQVIDVENQYEWDEATLVLPHHHTTFQVSGSNPDGSGGFSYDQDVDIGGGEGENNQNAHPVHHTASTHTVIDLQNISDVGLATDDNGNPRVGIDFKKPIHKKKIEDGKQTESEQKLLVVVFKNEQDRARFVRFLDPVVGPHLSNSAR